MHEVRLTHGPTQYEVDEYGTPILDIHFVKWPCCCNTRAPFLKSSALVFQNYPGCLSKIPEEGIALLQPRKMAGVSDDAEGRVRDGARDPERFKRRRDKVTVAHEHRGWNPNPLQFPARESSRVGVIFVVFDPIGGGRKIMSCFAGRNTTCEVHRELKV